MENPSPTPEEIAAACEAIQAGWTDAEREQRSRGGHGDGIHQADIRRAGYTIPEIRDPSRGRRR
jgi:hypothetical protein